MEKVEVVIHSIVVSSISAELVFFSIYNFRSLKERRNETSKKTKDIREKRQARIKRRRKKRESGSKYKYMYV